MNAETTPLVAANGRISSIASVPILQAIGVFFLPIVLCCSNQLVGKHTQLTGMSLSQVWSGLLVLSGLAIASGLLTWGALTPSGMFKRTSPFRAHHPWLLWSFILGWAVAWTLTWLTLPSGHLLKVLMLPIFFLVALRSIGRGDENTVAMHNRVTLTLLALAGSMLWFVAIQTFKWDRLVSDWMGPIDVAGRHYQYAQVLKAWAVLRPLEPSHVPLANLRLGGHGTELLNAMGVWGALPGAVLGASLILAWWATWCWLRRMEAGPSFSTELRRFGLALVALHGLATVLYVLFNMGISRQSYGSGPVPFVPNAAWWLLGAVLGWIVVKAVLAGRSARRVASGGRWWIRLVGYAISSVLLTTALLLMTDILRDGRSVQLNIRAASVTRAAIRDASGHVIAENVLAYDLWFKPSEFWAPSLLNPRDSAQEDNGFEPKRTDIERERLLLGCLDKWPQTRVVVDARLTTWPRAKNDLTLLAWAITPEMADAIKALAMPGLLIKPRTARQYPDGPLYAHAVGFASLADTQYGQEGLELVANRGLATVSTNAGANDRYGVHTTLIPGIQKTARDALQAGIQEHRATGGAIVVIDVQKNEIAAMVSAPDFDPNDFSTYRNPYQPDRILNRAISMSFPIGALITPLIAAHEIESGRVTAQTTVNLGTGPLRVGNTEVRDANFYGALTVEEIIAKSSNVGLAKLAMQLPLAELQGVSKTLGLGEPLGIPGLTGGGTAERKDWSEWTHIMHATPGQFIETNLMQVLKAYLPIAASGYLRTPTLLASSHGDMYGKRALSPETAATMRQALKLAVSDRGTAPLAQVSGASVAGKTATMMGNFWTAPASSKRLWRSDTSVFVGMLPAEQPKWLVGVLLEFAPGQGRVAGLSTAPVFAQVVRKGLLQEAVLRCGRIAVSPGLGEQAKTGICQ